MDISTDGWVNRKTNRLKAGQKNRKTEDGQIDKHSDGGWTDRQTDGWRDRQTNRLIDRKTD